jgi:DUF1680 family protein
MKKYIITVCMLLTMMTTYSQGGLTNTINSPYAKWTSVGLGEVEWTKGFWKDRFTICRDSMVPGLWQTYTSKDICYSFQNFRVAAGLDSGRFRGPSFHDGDFYKTLEAVAAMYASTKDKKLDAWMDNAISVIAKAQKEDGYIYTKSIIEQRKTGRTNMFDDKLSFEAYNFGHLMTAACVHFRATGKKSLLQVAIKATDFLNEFYNKASPEQARNAICPSHYMGIVEMYRTTRDPRYLALVKKLIDIRGTVEGTDDNSDRAPFREMNKVVGHAVRANYLFAGVADLYMENGDPGLLATLHKTWDNVANHKMYVTGGCGSLYDGVSVDGTSYKPDTVQKVHQAYGRDYQLPNLTAHNETCANIGNLLWNWRMLMLSGDVKYADIMELTLYNSILSGISLDGKDFFYTNPLAASTDFPYDLRWMGGRKSYISKSNCCPPNAVRTIAEVNNYLYGIGKNELFIHMYGGNKLSTRLSNGEAIQLEQVTNYPWEGSISILVKEIPSGEFAINLRIPAWCKKASIKINGQLYSKAVKSGQYAAVSRKWKPGDRIELLLDMPVTLIESNPLVEETRNQVAVKRGPVVYCLESADIPGQNVFDVLLQSSIKLQPESHAIGKHTITALVGTAEVLQGKNWNSTLYRELNTSTRPMKIRLIPYYAWANRGLTDMAVWMPVMR